MGHLFASLADGSAAFSVSVPVMRARLVPRRLSLIFDLPVVPCAASPVTRVPLAFRAHLCQKRSA